MHRSAQAPHETAQAVHGAAHFLGKCAPSCAPVRLCAPLCTFSSISGTFDRKHCRKLTSIHGVDSADSRYSRGVGELPSVAGIFRGSVHHAESINYQPKTINQIGHRNSPQLGRKAAQLNRKMTATQAQLTAKNRNFLRLFAVVCAQLRLPASYSCGARTLVCRFLSPARPLKKLCRQSRPRPDPYRKLTPDFIMIPFSAPTRAVPHSQSRASGMGGFVAQLVQLRPRIHEPRRKSRTPNEQRFKNSQGHGS